MVWQNFSVWFGRFVLYLLFAVADIYIIPFLLLLLLQSSKSKTIKLSTFFLTFYLLLSLWLSVLCTIQIISLTVLQIVRVLNRVKDVIDKGSCNSVPVANASCKPHLLLRLCYS